MEIGYPFIYNILYQSGRKFFVAAKLFFKHIWIEFIIFCKFWFFLNWIFKGNFYLVWAVKGKNIYLDRLQEFFYFKAQYCSACARKIIIKTRIEFAIIENINLQFCVRACAFSQFSFTCVHVRSSNHFKKSCTMWPLIRGQFGGYYKVSLWGVFSYVFGEGESEFEVIKIC